MRIRLRGAFLALMGVVFILEGYSFLALTPLEVRIVDHELRIAVDVAPLWVYGWAWVLCGILAIVDGLRPGVRSALGFTAAVIMPALFGCLALAAWLDGDLPRGWTTALVYCAIAGAIGIVAGMAEVPR